MRKQVIGFALILSLIGGLVSQAAFSKTDDEFVVSDNVEQYLRIIEEYADSVRMMSKAMARDVLVLDKMKGFKGKGTIGSFCNDAAGIIHYHTLGAKMSDAFQRCVQSSIGNNFHPKSGFDFDDLDGLKNSFPTSKN